MEKNSHEWYEQVYHAPKNMPDFKDYIQSAVDRGYYGRFADVLLGFVTAMGKFNVVDALEIGGHLGKTAHWLMNAMPHITLDIMDFSAPAVEYMKKNLGGRCGRIWQCDITSIDMSGNTYDLITCIDVAEHLDDITYGGMLTEISRLLKPSGHCIFYGAMSTHNTHTHIRNPATIIKDADGLLKFVKMLPHNHILFRGI